MNRKSRVTALRTDSVALDFLFSVKNMTNETPVIVPHVFLGGSCNPTTWRAEIAVPMLDCEAYVFNPQASDWNRGMASKEAVAKQEADVLLFVIDSQTRALASITEALLLISEGRNVLLVIDDVQVGTLISDKKGDQEIDQDDATQCNGARGVLRQVAQAAGTPIFESVEEACTSIVNGVYPASAVTARSYNDKEMTVNTLGDAMELMLRAGAGWNGTATIAFDLAAYDGRRLLDYERCLHYVETMARDAGVSVLQGSACS